MSKKGKVDYGLIKCKAHDGREQQLPWSIVCVHLITGRSLKWIPLQVDGRKDKPDWVCPYCEEHFDEIMERRMFQYVKPICVRCIHTLRLKYDPNYKPEEYVK